MSGRDNLSVSVVLPTYNRRSHLPRAIDSVLNQEFLGRIELIVVDDGSSDGTDVYMKSLEDARIVYVRHEANKGQAAAINTGISVASNEWIALQDSDDSWRSNKLSIQFARISGNCTIDCVVGRVSMRSSGANKTLYYPSTDHDISRRFVLADVVCGNIVAEPTILVKKSVAIKVGGFDEKIKNANDREFMIRVIAGGFIVLGVNEVLVDMQQLTDSLHKTRDPASSRLILTKHRDIYENFGKSFFSEKLTDTATDFAISGDREAAVTMLREAQKYDHWNLSARAIMWADCLSSIYIAGLVGRLSRRRRFLVRRFRKRASINIITDST